MYVASGIELVHCPRKQLTGWFSEHNMHDPLAYTQTARRLVTIEIGNTAGRRTLASLRWDTCVDYV